MPSSLPLSVKYRPKKFSEVVGQQVPIQILINSMKKGNLHHAYIFEGQFGSGKTTSARILAASENCEKPVGKDPCGVCDNCKQIFSGKSQDIIETNAARERGIDDVRSLSEKLKFSPLRCKVRYVIIDEAHSLTKQAAEALLKVIEEPPPRVKFILATTDAHSMIPTISSRCQSLNFSKVNIFEITEHIENIAKLEDVKLDEGVSKLAARYAKGSVRNALQNLQKMIDFSGEEDSITIEDANEVLGAISQNAYFIMIDSILESKVANAALAINTLLSKGKTASQITSGLAEHLRYLQLSKFCQDHLDSFDLPAGDIKKFHMQSEKVKLALLRIMIENLYDIHRAMALNIDMAMVFETFVIDAVIALTKLNKT